MSSEKALQIINCLSDRQNMELRINVRDTDAQLARCDADGCQRVVVIGAGVTLEAYEGWVFVMGSFLCPMHSE